MKKLCRFLFLSMLPLLLLISSVGCSQVTGGAEERPAEKPSGGDHFQLGTQHASMSESFTGTVVAAISAGRSVYVQIDVGERKVWVAVPNFDGEIGDRVVVPPGVPIADFHSRRLDRDFEIVYFVGGIHKEGEAPGEQPSQAMPDDHPPIGDQAQEQMTHPPMDELVGRHQIEVGKVEKVEGGQTVSEIITNRKDLAGEVILVRAKVVKYTPGIMDKNWLHVQDGTGGEGTNDLIVTTDAEVGLGNTVLIRGVVAVDRDFGYGLKYPVIIEDAKVTVE